MLFATLTFRPFASITRKLAFAAGASAQTSDIKEQELPYVARNTSVYLVGHAQVFLTNLTLIEGRYLGLQQIRILYAEDYELVLFTVKQLLELEGWRVDICRDGAAALKKIESDDHYDLIILDAQMPGESGVALVQRARQLAHRRRVPIIVFTGSLRREDALAAGADAFLNKPTGLKNLISTCNSLLDRQPAINESDTGDLKKSVGNML